MHKQSFWRHNGNADVSEKWELTPKTFGQFVFEVIRGPSHITQSDRSKTSERLHLCTTPSPNTTSELYNPSTSTSVKVIPWQPTPLSSVSGSPSLKASPYVEIGVQRCLSLFRSSTSTLLAVLTFTQQTAGLLLIALLWYIRAVTAVYKKTAKWNWKLFFFFLRCRRFTLKTFHQQTTGSQLQEVQLLFVTLAAGW